MGPVDPVGPVGPPAGPAGPVGPVGPPSGPVGPVGPVGPATSSSSTTVRLAFGVKEEMRRIFAPTAFCRDTVTGGATTLIIPTPYTSPVLIGETPEMLSPCDETRAKSTPATPEVCVATHQLKTNLPASLIVMTPVEGLYEMAPLENRMVSKRTFPPAGTVPFEIVRSICRAMLPK